MKEILYRKIYLHLKAGIKDGSLPAGDRLPGVREITKQWKTSANTVLKALSALEADGLIRKTQGQGIFVRERTEWTDPSAEGAELGIILYDMNEPFNLRLLSAVEKAADVRGYRLTIGNAGELVAAGVSGIVIVPSSAEYYKSAVGALDIPVIHTGKFSPPQDFGGHYVIADVYSGFFYAAGELLKSGRERLAYIGGAEKQDDDPGLLAVRDVLSGTRFGFRREFSVTAGGYDAEFGRKAAEGLLLGGEYPDAIICSNDTLAAGAIKACREAGLRIPADISIIGSGDQDIAPLLEPPLTSIRVPAEMLGRTAAGFVDELIRGRFQAGEKIRCRIDPELIVRGSALGAQEDEPCAEDELAWL
ncbi:MAG: GntR family transcriptional regulator [Spirochaetales bacterium]|nr:GntR family transcriptional regulator [Spirochaetales bacterium]